MDRKEACLAQALACRDQAAVDPANHDYWIDEAVKWLERWGPQAVRRAAVRRAADWMTTHFADSDAVWAAWSPSGQQIAFERDVYTGVRVTRAAIYTMNADGSGLRSLTPTGLNGRPSWSPNGSLIAFSTLQYGKQATISVMAVNGGRVRKVLTTPLPTKRFGLGLDSATFSPDGKRIAFVWIKKSGSAIFTMKASGGGL